MSKYEKKSGLEKVLSLGYAKEVLIISLIGAAILGFIGVLSYLQAGPIPLDPIDWAMIGSMAFLGPLEFMSPISKSRSNA